MERRGPPDARLETIGPMSAEKTIGVLTSGGDCPGLNAVLRGVVCASNNEWFWPLASRNGAPKLALIWVTTNGVAPKRGVAVGSVGSR